MVENGHAKHGNNPAYNSRNDDANSDGHGTTTDSRQHLATDDEAYGDVAYHEEDVEEARDLGRPVPHEVAKDDHGPIAAHGTPDAHVASRHAAQQTAEEGAHGTLQEAQAEDERPEEANGQVVDRDIGTEPEDGDLDITAQGRRLPLFGEDPSDAAGFEPGESLDAVIEPPEERRDGDFGFDFRRHGTSGGLVAGRGVTG